MTRLGILEPSSFFERAIARFSASLFETDSGLADRACKRPFFEVSWFPGGSEALCDDEASLASSKWVTLFLALRDRSSSDADRSRVTRGGDSEEDQSDDAGLL